ncbi:MAG: hypothetical protein JSR64_11070 [Nitrospira sp.]|nr:hypothetical protein [Nitrospira sp.]MBX3337180.1 hypothetical protein [Nitrospira sp.]MCW5780190.1 hypothetical protein [Nitrospira sp.]
MTFEDATLLRLAGPDTRAGVFDDTALEQLLNAGYDTLLNPVEGPFSAIFDDLRLGVPVLPVSVAEASWGSQTGSDRNVGTLQLAGFGAPPMIADAFWRGAIVTRTGAGSGRISEVSTAWPATDDIDEQIVAALGGLPANAAQLEQERRARFIAKLKAGMSDPNALTAEVFTSLLAHVGASSVSELFGRQRNVNLTGIVRIMIEALPAPPPSPKALPVAVAIIVRSVVTSLTQMLAHSRVMRERLDAEGMSRPEEPRFRILHNVLVAWVVPESIFDDDGWPGALPGDSAGVKRTKRRATAGQWLAREGIGLAVLA